MNPTLPWLASLFLATSSVLGAHAAEASRPEASMRPCDGRSSCKIDGFAVDVGGCGKGALFGSIAVQDGADGVGLDDRVDGKGQKVARLKDHQFVCIAATARSRGGQRHYVIAVPTASVPECRGKDLCKQADFPIQWKTVTTGRACQRVGDGRYSGDCAAGWVGEGELDQYADGL